MTFCPNLFSRLNYYIGHVQLLQEEIGNDNEAYDYIHDRNCCKLKTKNIINKYKLHKII